MAYTFAWFYT